MSTLEIKERRSLQKGWIGMLVATLSCILFAMIYNHFGHGVYSFYMTYVCLYPLVLGIGFYSIVLTWPRAKKVSRFTFNSYNSGVATLTIGSLLKGIFEIAGTSSPYVMVYGVVGIFMIGIALFFYIR